MTYRTILPGIMAVFTIARKADELQHAIGNAIVKAIADNTSIIRVNLALTLCDD